MYATFTGFEIEMTKNDALSMAHQGQCIDDVKAFLKTNKSIHKQLDKIGSEAIAEELKNYGAWDDTQLADVEANKEKIVWLAANNIREEN
jgi:hypothetical protein